MTAGNGKKRAKPLVIALKKIQEAKKKAKKKTKKK